MVRTRRWSNKTAKCTFSSHEIAFFLARDPLLMRKMKDKRERRGIACMCREKKLKQKRKTRKKETIGARAFNSSGKIHERTIGEVCITRIGLMHLVLSNFLSWCNFFDQNRTLGRLMEDKAHKCSHRKN